MSALLAIEEPDYSGLTDREKYRLRWLLQTAWAPLILDPAGGPPLERPRPNQLTPDAHALCASPDDCDGTDLGGHLAWYVWFVKAGRGFGKTRIGSEDVADFALTWPGVAVGLIAPTYSDGRDIMVEGSSGLLGCIPENELRGGSRRTAWNRSLGELVLANASHFKLVSAEKPDSPRGKNWHRAWADEPASWSDASKGDVVDTTWQNASLALRLPIPGHPEMPAQMIVTGTPKNLKLIKELAKRPRIVLTQGSTYENVHNLDSAFRDRILQYEGTYAGRQELHGEIIDEVEGALWTMEWFERDRVMPEMFERVYKARLRRSGIGVDPAATSSEAADDTGIVVAGKSGPKCPVCRNDDKRSHFFVWRDVTCHKTPAGWADVVSTTFEEEGLDKIIAERNNGGEMVEHTMLSVNDALPVEPVWASQGKRTRAQPIAALYEKRRVHHVGDLSPLEAECTGWDPEDEKAPSPNRMDALVWILWWLSQGHRIGTGRGSGGQIAEHRL